MKRVNWYVFSLYLVMMTVVGFIVFDNVVSSVIYGIVVGGIFGWLFATKKAPHKR